MKDSFVIKVVDLGVMGVSRDYYCGRYSQPAKGVYVSFLHYSSINVGWYKYAWEQSWASCFMDSEFDGSKNKQSCGV